MASMRLCFFLLMRRKFDTALAAAALIAMHLLTPDALAQRLSFGVVVGGYANRDFDSQYVPRAGFPPDIVESDSGGYVVGPSIDVRLWPQLSFGAEALYKPLRYRQAATFQSGEVIGFAPATVVTWQFPVLAKYKFSLGRMRPFLEGGASFRATGNLNSASPSHYGITAGLGVETEWRKFRIAPRVRYTRWAEDPWYANVRTRADQLEFLVGVSYAAASDTYPLGRRISLGAVLASPLTDEFRATTQTVFNPSSGAFVTLRTFSDPRRVGIGPLVELSLSPRFSIEGNAIARSFRGATKVLNSGGTTNSGLFFSSSFSSGGTWEFPVLAKYRLTTGVVRPFLALGPSFRLPKEIAGAWLSNYGATAGAGVEIPWKRIKIAPALRYTHWGHDRPRVAGMHGNSGIFRNQVQVSVGVSF